MNSTIYLFGDFGQGITLYPRDYTKNIFKEFMSKSNAPTQLIIHRDGAIMNYGYIRKIDGGHIFGICVQINGQYIATIKDLFEIFEDITTNIVVKGEILKFNKNGDIINNISKFSYASKGIEKLINYCQIEFLKMSQFCDTLPNIDYSTSDSNICCFKNTDKIEHIIKSSLKNGYTYVYKEEDYDSLALNGYKSLIYSINKENEENKNKIIELESSLSKLKRQKKQINVVIFLIIAMFFGILFFLSTIASKNNNIATKQQTIDAQTSERDRLIDEIDSIVGENEKIQNINISLQYQIELQIKYNDSIANELQKKEIEYNSLYEKYSILQSENTFNQKRIVELKQQNNLLTKQMNEYQENYKSLNTRYKNLEMKFNDLNRNYNTLSYKYYKTKEGKKELKNSK